MVDHDVVHWHSGIDDILVPGADCLIIISFVSIQRNNMRPFHYGAQVPSDAGLEVNRQCSEEPSSSSKVERWHEITTMYSLCK